MPDAQAGDLFEVRLKMTLNGQRLMNVLHYKLEVDSPVDLPTVYDDIATALKGPGADTLRGLYETLTSEQLSFDVLEVQDIYPIRYAFGAFNIQTQGTKEAVPLPQNVQLSFTKRTELAGRDQIGRMEVPGLCFDDQVEGKWEPDTITEAEALAAELLEPITTTTTPPGTLTPVLLHRGVPPTTTVITSVQVQDTVRVARRRTLRIGE